MDTIFALSTAQGKAGVAIIRVSGPSAFDAAQRLGGDIPPPRHAALRVLRDDSGVRLDQALVLIFPSGQSFTGDPVVEFHLHGSMAVVSAVLRVLGDIPGFRAAQPGEFTRRALENGCLDMAQVEGLADLLEAETEAQRRQALRVLSGDLGQLTEAWRRDLIRAVALLEATIDFADEEVPENVIPEVTELTSGVLMALKKQINGVSVAERIRMGFEVAIVGAPNLGKSTLLNALAGREAAITSEFAGTTRDVIEVRMDLGGLPVTLLDTAGLRETADVVESIGIDRAKQRADQADLRVFLIDGDTPLIDVRPDDIVLQAKADLNGSVPNGISGKTGVGIPQMVGHITRVLSRRSADAGLAIRERHRMALVKGADALTTALDLAQQGEAMADLAAEELHTGIRALDSLVGRVDVENVLDEIFTSFCLGK